MREFNYPKSFPTETEKEFLQLLIVNNKNFPDLWEEWKRKVDFDKIDYSILRLIPILYLRLKDFDIKDDALFNKIRGIYKMAWYKNQLTINSIQKLIFLLNKENIPVILLKGVPLIEKVYKDRGARFLGDADALIDIKYIEKVIKIMRNNGWRYVDLSHFYENRFKEPFNNKLDKEITFTDKLGSDIDIHWSLYMFLAKENREHPMTYGEIFNYVVDCNINGASYKMPCAEDMLIHIIVHGAERNNYRTLRWIVDTVYLINNTQIDWDFLIRRVIQFECTIEMNVAFSYLVKNFYIPIPEAFITKLSRLPMTEKEVNEYYKRANTLNISLFKILLFLWNRYWLYDKKGNFFTSWYYFFDYICRSSGVIKKREFFIFIFEKYKKGIKMLFNK